MRAKEFVINVPINIKINGDGDPEISTGGEEETPAEKTGVAFIPPLQQKIEMMKADAGKEDDLIDQITISDQDDDTEAD